MNKHYKWLLAFLFFVSMGVAMAAEVVLGPGDMIKISVFGNPDLSLETRVSAGGYITYPLLGEVKVGDMAPASAEKKIAGLLEKRGFVHKPQVTLVVTAIQSQQISVLGWVTRPGRYPMEGKRSLLDVLALAGGPNADGGDTVTLIRTRNGKTSKKMINLAAMMQSGNLSQDADLAGGDVVYVERAPKFYIYGEVQRPGSYRLEPNMTVVEALSAGGGLTPRGTERGIRIKRRAANGQMQVIAAKQNEILLPDDVVYVKESLF